MKPFSTINSIAKEMLNYAGDSAQRHLLALVNRDVRELIFRASSLEDSEINEAYPLFEDNEHLFEDYIGGRVILASAIEDLEPLKVNGMYLLDRAEQVGTSGMESLALVTNDAGGDLYYVPQNLIGDNPDLAEAIKSFRISVTAQLAERGCVSVE